MPRFHSLLAALILIGFHDPLFADSIPPSAILLYAPRYTQEAYRQGIEGPVTVQFSLDVNGVPGNPSVEKGIGYGLDEMAMEAIMYSRFQPAYRDGEPVPVQKAKHNVLFRMPSTMPDGAKPKLSGERQTMRGISFKDDHPDSNVPRLKYKVDPTYPTEARSKRIHGTVTLSLVVTKSGYPSQIKIVKSLGSGLDEETMIAVLKWRFYPASNNGEPVPFETKVEMRFHPN